MTSLPITPNHFGHVLVASPSTVVRQRVLQTLSSPASRVEQATGGAEALVHLEKGSWQVLFLDRRLPDLDAEELSQTIRQRFPGVEVVLLDPDSEAERVSAEPDEGLLPHDWPEALEVLPRQRGVAVQSILDAPLPGMIGNSRNMQPVYRVARLLARRNTTVLISGPTGSGKELVARAIHSLSPRADHPFAVVNCAAIPESLLESELFGYRRGAFTGALQSYAGRIQASHGGTLFLDEIGEMPLSLQPKLLRFLEQKELQRLGSSEVVRVDARVVTATNAHLLTLVREGKFREDLYYRLCAFPLEIPPLCERLEDIAQLASHFLEQFALRMPAPELSAEVLQVLQRHTWPGNIRELQNVMERALILADEDAVIRPEHLWLVEAGFRSGQ
ncbi:MAG: sigma-54 dependent transcriptional regulator [Acidobacteriia bacterium]|nr:sigma-54 dependent transcriptional regulator [Terriglobia bacterium]